MGKAITNLGFVAMVVGAAMLMGIESCTDIGCGLLLGGFVVVVIGRMAT